MPSRIFTLFCAVMSHLLMPAARRSAERDDVYLSVNGCCAVNWFVSNHWSTLRGFLSERTSRSALPNPRTGPDWNVTTQLTCQFATSLLTTGLEEAANFRPGPNGSS